jgi:membrane protease YdiL (CAAX protease family)
MVTNYRPILQTAKDAIHADDSSKAMSLLVEAVRQDPGDPRPWLMMVRLAPTRDIALIYLRQAEIFGPETELVKQEQEWIETNFSEQESERPLHTAITQQIAVEPDEPLSSMAETQRTVINRESSLDHVEVEAAQHELIIDLETNLEQDNGAEAGNLISGTDQTILPGRWVKTLPRYVSIIYLVLLAIAELVSSLGVPPWGIVLHGGILFALIIQGTMYGDTRERAFLISLSFAPLIRIISFTTPLTTFPQVYWYAIVGAPLLVAVFALIRTTGLKNHQIGIRVGNLPVQLLISLVGIGLGFLEYLILKPEPLVADFTFEAIIGPALILLIFTGFLEELVFRGVFQYCAVRHLGKLGFVYVSMVFAIMHIGYLSVLDFGFVFLVAMIFAYLVQRTGSILGVTLAHGLTNIGLFLIFPFLMNVP